MSEITLPVAVPALGLRAKGSIRSAAVTAALWMVFAGNMGAIFGIWLSHGGVSSVVNLGTAIQSTGRITGLLAGYFVLIQVALLVRIPWLERRVGFDRLTVWHRRNGKLSLVLVLIHVVAITVGYAMVDGISIPTEISQFLAYYPWMIAAIIGTVLMILVVAESLVIVRRKLPYESWYLVHLTAYLAIALGWFHQIPTGFDLTTHATAALYWTGLYVGTLVLLLGFRFALPFLQGLRRGLRVREVVPEARDVVSVIMTGRRLDRMNVRAGQFMLFRFMDRRRCWESHPFSISALPESDTLRITVKGVGGFSRGLRDLKPGTWVLGEGPYGVFTAASARRERVLLIAGGIGITPIRTLMEELQGDIVVLWRVRSEDDIILRAELEELASRRRIRLEYLVGDHADPNMRHLLSTENIRSLVPDVDQREVYLCGPPAMTSLVQRAIKAAGTPDRHVHSEKFAL